MPHINGLKRSVKQEYYIDKNIAKYNAKIPKIAKRWSQISAVVESW